MARYIDADAALELIEEEFHKTSVNGAEQIGVLTCHRIVREAPTADVVPRAEVERLTVELEAMRTAATAFKLHYEKSEAEADRLRSILDSYALQYGTVKDQREVMDRIKKETAREIFAEIDAIIQRNTEHTIRNGFICVSGYNCKQIVRLIYELKNKYTEDAG